MTGSRNEQTDFYHPDQSPSLKSWGEPVDLPRENVCIECGWGKLLFGHTFKDNEAIAEVFRNEEDGTRDVALYIRDPQVLIAKAPHALFIDPSYTFRLSLESYIPLKTEKGPFSIRMLDSKKDIDSVNRIYQSRDMVPIDPNFMRMDYKGQFIQYWVAVDDETEEIVAVCMGIDHKRAFDDPENGASLWSLAVDPQAKYPGIGLHMVQFVAAFYKERQRTFLDLSVMHSNKEAIALYKKLGFVQIPVFCIKNKNSINETLFTGPKPEERLTPYAAIIINEARRRGIRVDILDKTDNYFRLSSGGTSIVCRESLSEMTSSIAMSRCSDRRTTTQILKQAGLNVPDQCLAQKPSDNHQFLQKHSSIVVKPATGEAGTGVTVNVRTKNELENAIEHAEKVSRKVLLEEMLHGEHLRIVVIDYQVAAAALRKPPTIVGDGQHSILQLIKKQSRRREKATYGASKIPIGEKLRRTVHNAGYVLEDILPKGEELQVHTAVNLHVGGTMHDVTESLHPHLTDIAQQAAHAIDIPVVGLDLIIASPSESEYNILEAHERPGLANHEPQPIAERFVDFLFPQSIARNA